MPSHTDNTSPRANRRRDGIRTVSLVSLGCPKNLVDSEKMLGLLASDGLAIVSHDPSAPPGSCDPADAIVVNTCGFLEASKEESLQVIHEALAAKAAGAVKRVVVAGCLVQRHRAKILEWAPGIDALVGVFDRDRIVEAVRGKAPKRLSLADASDKPAYWIASNALHAARDRGRSVVGLTVNGKDGRGVGYFEDDSARLRLTPRHYAYLRVSEGCNQNCAFCTIPSIRGKMRSKPLGAIVAEARELIADGAFELNLIGQDTTSYGDDIGVGLDGDGRGGMPAMLGAVAAAFDDAGAPRGWVRLMYAYPSNFSPPMIDAFARLAGDGSAGRRVVPYIDMPLQHASDAVLAAMRRRVTCGQQREVLLRLRERVPGMALRTTFISGFPGETEADHERLLDFVREMRFDMVGVFEYSPEDGTPAGTMERDPALAVPAEVKRRRRDEIMALQQSIAFERAAGLARAFDPRRPADTGASLDILIDERDADAPGASAPASAPPGTRLFGHRGRAHFQAPLVDSITHVTSRRALSPGEVVRCVVVGSDGYDLVARPADELARRVALPLMTGAPVPRARAARTVAPGP